MDRFAPIAPARVKVLVLPVGPVERSRFELLLKALRTHAAIVPLKRVPTQSDDQHLLTALHWPIGSVIYDYTTSSSTEQHRQLSPFELFHESLLILGVIDAREKNEKEQGGALSSWNQAKEALRERQPHAILRQLIILGDHGNEEDSKDVIWLSDGGSYDSQLQTAIYALTTTFLRELSSYAQALPPDIKTPGQTSRSLQSSQSRRNADGRPTSGYGTPTGGSHVSSPVGGNEGSRPSSRDRNGSPPTSFDQITSASRPMPNMLSRSDSRTSNRSGSGQRDSSRERRTQGFGTLSASKMKERGAARVGIVLASIRMMGGHWKKALEELVIHTSKANSLHDHIWHAKGLENMMICMLLMAWEDLTFSVPLMCFTESNRRSAQFIGSTSTIPDNAKLAAKQSLSKALPNLTAMILELYRMAEGSLEVQPLVPAEASVRFSKLLAMRLINDAVLNEKILVQLVVGPREPISPDSSIGSSPNGKFNVGVDKLLRTPVASMLTEYCRWDDDSIRVADQIQLLAGTISVYSLLRMERKKAMTIKELVLKLTAALQQARKLGAAEQGVHPSTSLHSNSGQSLRDSEGTQTLVAQLVRVYGVDISSGAQESEADITTAISALRFFGWDLLKFDIVRNLIVLSEAQADAAVVWKLVSVFLKLVKQASAEGMDSNSLPSIISADEQSQMLSLAARSMALAKSSSREGSEGHHWDPLFVRGFEIDAVPPHDVLLDRAVLASSKTAPTTRLAGNNPLLYDPNRSRPGTAEKIPEKRVLICGEAATCVITFQNRLDVSTHIESIQLVTEGVDVKVNHQPIKLAPECTQQVYISVSPCAPGETKITGCRIVVAGCAEAVFRIVSKPWMVKSPPTIKYLGLEGADGSEMSSSKQGPAEFSTISATVVKQQAKLRLVSTNQIENATMLLEGEHKSRATVIYNDSKLPARIFRITSASNVPTQDASVEDVVIDLGPAQSITYDVKVLSIAGCSEQRVGFYYCAVYGSGETAHEGNFARVLTLPLNVTVNAGLQIRKLDVYPDPQQQEGLVVSITLHNVWPRIISFCFEALHSGTHGNYVDGTVGPGLMKTVHVLLPRWSTMDCSDEEVRAQLFERLLVRWHIGDERTGVVNLHGIALSSESLAAIRESPLLLILKHLPTIPPREQYKDAEDFFVSIEVSITNRVSGAALTAGDPLLLELLTAYGDSGQDIHNDLPLAFDDSTSRIVGAPARGETKKEVFSILPRFAGRFKVHAQVKRIALGHAVQLPQESVFAEKTLAIV